MVKIKLPASVEAAVEELNGIGELLRAREWHKAAIVASFVELSASRAHTRPGMSRMSTVQFAELGVNGLRKPTTIQLYVQRWLDANDGEYPVPGKSITLPTDEWPPTRTGTDGYDSEEGAQRTIDRLVEQHGAGVIADAVARRPDLAEGFAGKEDAVGAILDADLGHATHAADRRRGQGHSPMGTAADAMQKLMLQLGATAFEGAARDMCAAITRRTVEGVVWRPGEREAVMEKVESGLRYGADTKALLSGLSDEDLANLLAGQ